MKIFGVGAAYIGIMALATFGVQASDNSLVGEIKSTTGEVIASGGQGYQKVAVGSEVQSGAIVSAGHNSGAIIAVGNNCLVEVQANSEVVVPALSSIDQTCEVQQAQTFGANLEQSLNKTELNNSSIEAFWGSETDNPFLKALFTAGVPYGIFVLAEDDEDNRAGMAPATP